VDAGGEGLEHRTAWAGVGDGVLFYDADGDGKISQKREFVFTEWDPSAPGDLEALASVFDSNGDRKLTSADAAWASFKVMVTGADGTRTAQTLGALGITEISLRGNAVEFVLPDGSVIPDQTVVASSAGGPGIAAADGFRAREERAGAGADARRFRRGLPAARQGAARGGVRAGVGRPAGARPSGDGGDVRRRA
jgi:hypothetical protein